MILSARVVRKPRKPHDCGRCGARIRSIAVKLYGMAETGDKPYTLYYHPLCVNINHKKGFLARVAALKLEDNPTLTIAAATTLARQELGYDNP